MIIRFLKDKQSLILTSIKNPLRNLKRSETIMIIYSANLTFIPIVKPHTHKLYYLKHCSNNVYIFVLFYDLRYQQQNKILHCRKALKSNIKMVKTMTKPIPLTQIYLTAHFIIWFRHFSKEWQDYTSFMGPNSSCNEVMRF